MHAEEPKRMAVPPAEPGATADPGAPDAGSCAQAASRRDAGQARARAVAACSGPDAPTRAGRCRAGRGGPRKGRSSGWPRSRRSLAPISARPKRPVASWRKSAGSSRRRRSARTKAERTADGLRREIERLRSTEEQRAAQARFVATHQPRTELATEIERVHGEHTRVVDGSTACEARSSITTACSTSTRSGCTKNRRLRRRPGPTARAEEAPARRGTQSRDRHGNRARHAEDDHARLVKVEEEVRDTVLERDRRPPSWAR